MLFAGGVKAVVRDRDRTVGLATGGDGTVSGLHHNALDNGLSADLVEAAALSLWGLRTVFHTMTDPFFGD